MVYFKNMFMKLTRERTIPSEIKITYAPVGYLNVCALRFIPFSRNYILNTV